MSLPEGVTAVTRYVARDGTEFTTVDGAKCHNEDCDAVTEGNKILHAGGTVYDAVNVAYFGHMRFGPPDILKQMSQDTPLIIPHWQCRDIPAYKVVRLTLKGVFVWGNAGSWSGPYGDIVSIQDLARYVENTFKRIKQ